MCVYDVEKMTAVCVQWDLVLCVCVRPTNVSVPVSVFLYLHAAFPSLCRVVSAAHFE